VLVTAGEFRLVRSPIRVTGYEPDYRPAPALDEHGDVTSQSS
jgi:CoA:oxalate CoA-transferase